MSDGLDDSVPQSTAGSFQVPVPLRFLLDHGFGVEELAATARLADRIGVSAEICLIASGGIEAPAYYRALALHLGLPFTRWAIATDEARFPESIEAGIMPCAMPLPGLVLAPRGQAITKLAAHRQRLGTGVAITTPASLQSAVLRARAAAISRRASYALLEWRSSLCSEPAWTGAQLGAFCLGLLVLMLSLSRGLATPLVALGLAASPLFLAMVVTRLAACLLPNPIEPGLPSTPISDRDLPIYTVIVALFQERRVLAKLLASLSRLDYPPAKLDVKLVIEADDRQMQEALAEVALPGFMEIVVAPPGFPRTKPRALNVALPLARGDLTVIYDAEDDPDPGQLRLAASRFAHASAAIGCLQARLTIDNTHDTWLTRMFTIEYAALFDVFNPGLADMGSPLLLGGTSNHFRTGTLRAIGAWDAWNVTEDADLGIRLARFGYRVADLPSSTLEEAPGDLAAWMKQRTRWMKGFIQTVIVHSRDPGRTFRELGLWRFYGAMTVTAGTVVSALGFPIFTVFLAWRWASGADTASSLWQAFERTISATLFVAGGAAIYLPAAVALARRRLWRLLPWVLLLPAYYCLVSIAAWRGLWELIRTPFHWNKTDHGLARTSRRSIGSETPREPGHHHVLENRSALVPPQNSAHPDEARHRTGEQAAAQPGIVQPALFGFERSRHEPS
ncbi:glycosyltransferase [Microvirga antarctica]|uniref:glycosyltransferase n=1 Tax=Microvirga antarctica TaxID=2819233 RepID=UPI001B3089E9|nr:glycosyltransferase [Microvirga antarctica]